MYLFLLPSSLGLNNGVVTPALGFSTWNHFGGSVSDALIRELADAMNTSGLLEAGYQYLNLDDGWAHGRFPNGTIIPDPALFPYGMKPLIDYVRSRNIKFGIYTARGSLTCMGRPGSNGYEALDAATYAEWGVEYLKEDSCGGTVNGTVFEQYARMRDGLNATGKQIYFSITEAVPWTDAFPSMHCYGNNVFTVIPWVEQGLNPADLANSFLVEYCNNMDVFGYTGGQPTPGGFLSNLDSQALLNYDNLTAVGAFADNDMLECCNGGQTQAEYRSQFSTWAILASPLILGNDPRSMDADCLEVILNTEVIAINQDPLVVRGGLVYQWPDATWPNQTTLARERQQRRQRGVSMPPTTATAAPPPPLASSAPSAPFELASLSLEVCNATNANQLFYFNTTDSTIRTAEGSTVGGGYCLTYAGYSEKNFWVTECDGWTVPGIGSQLWVPPAGPSNVGAIGVVDNAPKVMDVYDCSFAQGSAQVCTQGGSDCYSSPSGPPGCGQLNQIWNFSGTAASPSLIASAVDGYSHCLQVAPMPPGIVNITLQIWAKPLANGDIAALLFNRGLAAIQGNLTWPMVGLPETTAAQVRDVWQHADLGAFTGSFVCTVQPHDVVMVVLKPQAQK